jgi:hypothetical protein
VRGKQGAKAILAVGSAALSLVLVEAALRLAIEPSVHSSGRLFGLELPPLNVLPSDYGTTGRDLSSAGDEPYRSLRVNGIAITRGDMCGILREDPYLAYAPRENSASRNGWWRSNNYGARYDRDIAAARTPGRFRALFFGDSFAHGSRLPQQETFTSELEAILPDTELLNFGVDGYSTGQAYLRYTTIADRVEFDQAVLVTVPSTDLWRDLSVSRYIGDRWAAYKLQPRFYLTNGKLELARSPFADLAAQLADGPEFRTVRKHLLAHDSFYFPEFEPSPALDGIVSARLLRRTIAEIKKRRIHAGIRSPDSEAMQVTHAIVRRFRADTVSRGASFVLVLLPLHSDVLSYQSDASFRREWDQMRDRFCSVGPTCIDLMKPLASRTAADLDFGYDGTHYGPKTSRLIARMLVDAGLKAAADEP